MPLHSQRASLALLALAACHDAPTAPLSGLPVSLTGTATNARPPAPTIAAAGDSVVMTARVRPICGTVTARAGRLFDVAQPRISDLKRGKIGFFTIDALVNMLARTGVHVRPELDASAA